MDLAEKPTKLCGKHLKHEVPSSDSEDGADSLESLDASTMDFGGYGEWGAPRL